MKVFLGIIFVVFSFLISNAFAESNGQVIWDQDEYWSSDKALVQVVSQLINQDKQVVDNWQVNVWSDSDAGGIWLDITETGPDTGIFRGTVFFVTTGDSDDEKRELRVSNGDTLTAKFKFESNPEIGIIDDVRIFGNAKFFTESAPSDPFDQTGSSNLPEITVEPQSLPDPIIEVKPESISTEKLPDWIRNVFIWYAEERISESELLSAIQFLVDQGIIKIKAESNFETKGISTVCEHCLELVSISSNGDVGIKSSSHPSLSADGRFVTFISDAPNLVPDDENFQQDVFVRDLVSKTTSLVSISSTGTQGNEPSYQADISANGRFIVFSSNANNLVEKDETNPDIFVHDRETGKTWKASEVLGGGFSAVGAYEAKIFGNLVLFEGSFANFEGELFIHNLQTKETKPIASEFVPFWDAEISENGRFVVLSSDRQFIEGQGSKNNNIYYYDVQTDELQLVNISIDGKNANRSSHNPKISADGRFVLFSSEEPNLVKNDNNYDEPNLFLRNMVLQETELVSILPNGEQATTAHLIDISRGGNLVAFIYKNDVYIRDVLLDKTIKFASLPQGFDNVIISKDFNALVFQLDSDALPEDTNEKRDVYIIK